MEGGSALLTGLQPNFLAHPRGQPHILSLSSASRESKLKLLCSPPSHKIPPTGKGSLYIRPLLMGTGAVLGLAPAPEYTFLIYVSPVGNYFKEGVAPISLVVEHELHRATPGVPEESRLLEIMLLFLKRNLLQKLKDIQMFFIWIVFTRNI